MLNWARDRQPIFFSHLEPYGLTAYTNAPGFNKFGGRVPLGFSLEITNTGGTIYYTTNGSDPRTAFTGAVSASALTYGGPLTVNSTVTIRARAVTGGNWSALTEATFTVGSLGIPLRLTEIMYNPPGGSLYEFIELLNTSSAAVDLSGMYFDGITFQFTEEPFSRLAPGARLERAIRTPGKLFTPASTRRAGSAVTLTTAANISLFDKFDHLITSVHYSDGGGWPTTADREQSLTRNSESNRQPR
ncbi:MAG: chitobiase/beta-hexosaminidase C-terminal domain-containing protein [Verrucomicrobiota bacterium]